MFDDFNLVYPFAPDLPYRCGGRMRKIQYGFGDFLGKHAGTIGGVLGGALGTIIAPGVGTALGAKLGSGIGNIAGSGYQEREQEEALAEQQRIMQQQALNQQIQQQAALRPQYSFRGGGMIPNIGTTYENGGTHESNRFGGIPIGRESLVEEGEFRFDDPDTGESYIFTNRF